MGEVNEKPSSNINKNCFQKPIIIVIGSVLSILLGRNKKLIKIRLSELNYRLVMARVISKSDVWHKLEYRILNEIF